MLMLGVGVGAAIGVGVGIAIGVLMSRLFAGRARKGRPDGTALLSLEYELFAVIRHDGRAALEAHGLNWKRSSIFARYPSIAGDDVVRGYLIEAMLLLADDANAADLDNLLTASLRVQRKRRAPDDRADAERRNRTLHAIRQSVLSMSRSASIRPGPLARDDRSQPGIAFTATTTPRA